MDYDFSFFLVIASLVTGVVWGGFLLYLKFVHKPYPTENEPLMVEYARSFFPVVLVVLLLRSFFSRAI